MPYAFTRRVARRDPYEWLLADSDKKGEGVRLRSRNHTADSVMHGFSNSEVLYSPTVLGSLSSISRGQESMGADYDKE